MEDLENLDLLFKRKASDVKSYAQNAAFADKDILELRQQDIQNAMRRMIKGTHSRIDVPYVSDEKLSAVRAAFTFSDTHFAPSRGFPTATCGFFCPDWRLGFGDQAPIALVDYSDRERPIQWYREGVAIPGATGPTYALTLDDFDNRISPGHPLTIGFRTIGGNYDQLLKKSKPKQKPFYREFEKKR